MKIFKKAPLFILLSLICLMSLPSVASAPNGIIRPTEFDIVVVNGGNNPLQTPLESLELAEMETVVKSENTGIEESGNTEVQNACRVSFKRKEYGGLPDRIQITAIPYMSPLPTVTWTINPFDFYFFSGVADITHPFLTSGGVPIIYQVRVDRGGNSHLFTAIIFHDAPPSSCPPAGGSGSFKLDTHDDSSSMNDVSIFPTPCRTHQSIEYSLNKDAHVNISVFDIQGRLHTVVNDAYQEEGFYSLNVDTSPLPPGIYFYKIRIDDIWSEHKFVKME